MIQIENISFSYNGLPVLSDISFSVNSGEFVSIIGPNGAGKSTLLKLMDRILIPDLGTIFLEQKNVNSYSHKALARFIGYVPQDFNTAFNFNVLDVVLMGRFPHQRSLRFDSRLDYTKAYQAMQSTDCFYLRDRPFLSLSGGEKQRVVLASALAQEPKILLLDEPTTALDLKHQVHFYQILQKLQQEENMIVITVTHDINLAARYCQRVLILKSGRIAADGKVIDVLKKEKLEDVYETPIDIIQHPESGLPVIISA